MGRKNSLAKNSIQMLCVMQHLDEQNLYEKTNIRKKKNQTVMWS